MKKIIKITLRSDLCAGSGYAYAGVIDMDCCYDELGIPYIPARRLKGCLREAGELIGEDVAWLGKWGQDGTEETKVSIYDAHIVNYDEIFTQIAACEKLTKEIVLAQYTSVKAQTEIGKNGIAKENTLRFARVVNQYDPLTKQPLVFEAELDISDEKAVHSIENCVKALRHLGMDRNRGLGNVKCELVDAKRENNNVEIEGKFDGEENARLCYTIVTDSPVMLSANNDSSSETFINGQSVHGFFATRYLRENALGDEFEWLFLKGGLYFSPLYPSDLNGVTYYPAPSYFCMLKKSKLPVNTAAPWPEEANGDPQKERLDFRNGNQPKKQRGKYISSVSCMDFVREVEMEIIYHNRHEGEEQKKQLYISRAVKKGQYFSGTVVGKASDVRKMAELLEKNTIIFGKSKTAQYGKCRLVNGEMKKAEKKRVGFEKGDRIFVTLQSDALFLNNNGYTVRTEQVRKMIQDTLGISVNAEEKADSPYSEIEVKELTGYYGKWNLRRPSVPAICAGSTFEYVLAEDISIDADVRVGVRCAEGFGMIDVKKNDGIWEIKIEEEKKEGQDKSQEEFVKSEIYPLYQNVVYDEIKRQIEERNYKEIKKSPLNPSAVGRLTLMLNESLNESRENGKIDYGKVEGRLREKVESIKNKEKQASVKEFVKKHYEAALGEEQEKLLMNRADEMRAYCLKNALVLLKYKAKEAGWNE